MRSLLTLAALLLAEAALASPPRFVDYLYIEANEGGSSGGHAAIRFGDETYHFQHERPGLLRLRRDDWSDFRWAYGVLENRTMHMSRVPVPDAIYTRLRQRFNERYQSERRVFAQREALRDDRVLLELLLARRRGDTGATIRIRGGGFFLPADDRSAPSPTVLALRRRVEQVDGPASIRRRMEEVRRELEYLAPALLAAPAVDIPADGYPDFGYPLSRRYRDLLTALIALHVLEHGLPLRPDSIWESTNADLRLDAGEQETLAAYADRLTDELTRLLHSDRPDWGFAFLVGMARLEALRTSIATGHLLLLDAFPPQPDVIRWSYVRQHREVVPDLRAEARAELVRARARLRAGVPDEETFAAVEAAGNRLLELDAAIAQVRDVRVSADRLLPARSAAWPDLVVPEVPEDDLARRLAQAKAAEEVFAERLGERFGYNLVTRNCVSELFRTMDTAGAQLGAHVDTRWSLGFIPFVSARVVNDAWDVAQRKTLWSYRRSRLRAMCHHENPLRVRLRESNVLTSTIYRTNAGDSFFLLFTDDAATLRPLFGSVNLVAGLGAAAVGLPLLPFDRGHTLMTGLRGALFSLPELAFVSLRKGSFDYLPRTHRPPDALAEVVADGR